MFRIFGLVVYTGSDTKIMKNSKYNTHKKSFVERVSQYYTYLGFFIVLLFAIVMKIII
jgi:magnesium-transporting ATPase (P-type)